MLFSRKLTRFVPFVFGGLIATAQLADASNPIKVVVVRENAVGSTSQAQPHLDNLLNLIARKLGWQSVEGKYFNRRKKGVGYIEKEQPHFGILSLATYLGLKDRYRLKVIGQVRLSVPGESQYFIVSKGTTKLDDCKQQVLASNHLGDLKFIENVVASHAFKLSDFSPLPTNRPIQTIKVVIRDRAKCALIDDAQLNESKSLQGGADLKVVWKSRKLPPMPVVAFAPADAGKRKQFRDALSHLCQKANRELCSKVGISSLGIASDSAYAKVVAAYSK
jgi:hypothetical protein